MRMKLTPQKAQELLAARVASGKSQYVLADELGWVRSKIKRIEKQEISSIKTTDLVRLERALGMTKTPEPNVQESSKPRATRKGAPPFRVLEVEDRVSGSANQVFFRVRMTKEVRPEELLGYRVKSHGYQGSLHGVENSIRQDPLRAGDELVVMVWGPGIAQTRGSASSAVA